jgi:hypothetical protein
MVEIHQQELRSTTISMCVDSLLFHGRGYQSRVTIQYVASPINMAAIGNV